MAKFSKKSLTVLSEACQDLQILFQEVIKNFDCKMVCSYRNKKDQDAAVASGNSTTPFPKSKHNKKPSDAIDADPCPVDFKNKPRYYYFAGYVKATADRLFSEGKMKKRLRCGADFNQNNDPNDEKLGDLRHFEVI